jgi:hypothetical protein
MQPDKKDPRHEEGRNEYIPGVQEKATIGGAYNSGVTSDDPEEKEEIEKKGSLAVLKPKPEKENDEKSQNP